jgi:type VI secretion system protein ImpA
MPSPATIDIDALLKPIAGDDPAGDSLPGETAEKFKQFREEFDPSEYPNEHPMSKEPRKDANWRGIIDLGEETLKGVSKNLVVAARMVEALTMQHGPPGARDGFRLLRRLSEDCWDRMHPKVEGPDDLETRADRFDWLDLDKGGSLYPNKLKAMPLLVNGSARISVLAWKGIPGDDLFKPTVTSDQLTAAAHATDPTQCKNLLDDVTETIEEVDRLGKVLGEKMGDMAPSFHKVREALDDCRTLAQGIWKEGGQGAEPGAAGEGATTAGGVAGPAVSVADREGAYRQLIAAAAALRRVEPHSPVPYLIERAVQLKDVGFPELVEQLTKDKDVLSFLKRDLAKEEED